jgi:glycosyltransferase involved in cell wall biosynthesis
LKKEKCQVVENWVATEKLLKLPFNISPDTAINETFKVLYLGDIIESKGVFDLLRAFDHCRKDPDMPALKLVLAGMGKDYDRAKEWISERALDNDITLLGYVPYAKLDDLFAGIDVFVLPSYVEGLPNSLIEAMSAGKPVITTPVGGIPDIISPGDNGIFVEPGNDRGIYESLKRILSDGEFRVTLAKNARYTASSRFKVNEAVDKFYRIIDN